MSIPFRRTTDNRVVASIDDGWLSKRIRSERDHVFHDLGAIAFDATEFDNKRGMFHSIEVYDRSTGINRIVTTAKFLRNCKEIHFEGHGRQYALELRFWDETQGPFQPSLL